MTSADDSRSRQDQPCLPSLEPARGQIPGDDYRQRGKRSVPKEAREGSQGSRSDAGTALG